MGPVYWSYCKNSPGFFETIARDRDERLRWKGVGDLVAFIMKYLGISWAIKRLFKGKDCGCSKRQTLLNNTIPFKAKS